MNPFINTPINTNQPKNPLLESLMGTIDFARSFQSPQAFMQSLQRENPAMYQQLVQLSQQISNPMQAAVQMLQQQGIDPQMLMSKLHNR